MNGITSATQTQATQSSQAASGGRKVDDATSAYLAEFRKNNPGVNIAVADFSSEKQFDAYMFGSSGANNVVLPTNVLKQMAADPAVAAKYEKLIGEMPENAKATQKYCDDRDQILYGAGMRIDRNGKVTYWMVGGEKKPRENPGNVFRDKIQKQIAEKREARKAAEKLEAKRLEKAESFQKLMEKLSVSKQDVMNVPVTTYDDNTLDLRI